jgi:dihydrofolate reductase
MGKIILYMITTMDGFISGVEGGSNGYEPNVEEMEFANDLFGRMNALLFGRVVYQGFTDYWDTLDLNDETIPPTDRDFARLFRTKKRVVFSRTLETVDPQAVLIHDNIAAEVTALKAQHEGDLLLVCGPALLSTLLSYELVDEFQILVAPLLLGQGVSLFGELSQPLNCTLLSTHRFASGSLLNRYQPLYTSE